MSIKLMSKVWEEAEVSGSELLVLLALADYANDDGTSIYPSMQSIAKKSRLSIVQARRTIHKLIAKGIVELVEMGGWDGKRNRSNEYRIVSMRGTSKLIAPITDDSTGTITDDSTVLSPMIEDPSYNHHKEPSEEKQMPPVSHHRTLPGVPQPRWRKAKRDADRIAKQRDKLGLSAKELTALTDKVLERMNALDLANSDTDFGDEEFTQAQQASLALAFLGHKTPAAIDAVFDTWSTQDWRGKKGEAPNYKTLVEHAKTVRVQAQQTPVKAPSIVVQRLEGEDW